MRTQALIILATFASLAGAAVAEETVETTDGRRILLRDDGRYEILPAGTLALPACKPAEEYTERDKQQLIEQHRKVCVVARLEDSTEKIASLAILEAPESVESTSGWVDLSTQREEVKDYLIENCRGTEAPAGLVHRRHLRDDHAIPQLARAVDHRARPRRAQAMKADPHGQH